MLYYLVLRTNLDRAYEFIEKITYGYKVTEHVIDKTKQDEINYIVKCTGE
ncbi:MAG: hypothetical protein QME45_11675 [Clostridiales bacterium]|nr:hypothetical protein [Clostridiales bacterium]